MKEFIGRFTMIVGDINSGKTTLTGQMLEAFCRSRAGGKATVVDLAPEITSQDLKGGDKITDIGGTLRITGPDCVRYYHPRVHPPRLRARNPSEAELLADENARTIKAVFEKALLESGDAIFVNDCSLYLHSGSASELLILIRAFPTAVVNGYFGRYFSDSSISIKERSGMEFLMGQCDRLIKL